MLRPLWFLCLCLIAAPCLAAVSFDFPPAAIEDRTKLSAAMPRLAQQVIAKYQDKDRVRYLNHRFQLQIVAGRYADAQRTLTQLRALTMAGGSAQARANNVQYEAFTQAKARQARDGTPFDEAFRQAFRETLVPMDDRSSALAMRAFGTDPNDLPRYRQALQDALERQKGKTTIALDDALALIDAYQIERAYSAFAPLVPALVQEEDGRRYLIEKDIQVRTPDGATVCALVVRQRSTTEKLPALLNFTIYAEPAPMLNEARRSASNGYAGVGGMTRGKGCSPDQPVPYEYDGRDAAALIDWIAAQPWSDGRVGMFGGSYTGFTQWAAAKRRSKALKALMPSVTAAPGIDVPMEGNIFFGFQHYWPLYVTNNKTVDTPVMNDNARWWRMYREWYVKGSAYRDRDKIDGTPNPFYRRWLQHPDYDAYWQDMIPYRREFATIDIPVLTTTGYFDGAQIGALYYLREHYKYKPDAEHYLVIGPYNHLSGQRGTIVTGDTLRGYKLDPVALLDIGELRYQWFDYVFKSAPKPVLLKDRINYQVMGANVWKHAPTLAAMGERKIKFHLSTARTDGTYRFTDRSVDDDAFVVQKVDLAARGDVDRVVPGGGILDKAINTADSLVFVSEPFAEAVEFSGLFGGRLDLATNKRDFDLYIGLYELTPQGEYFQLSRYQMRISYIQDRAHRRLLVPGERMHVDFSNGRLTSRRFQPGSRLVALIGPGKGPLDQINYGSGKDVSAETIADAKEPLEIKWFGASYIEIPVSR